MRDTTCHVAKSVVPEMTEMHKTVRFLFYKGVVYGTLFIIDYYNIQYGTALWGFIIYYREYPRGGNRNR
jgi:hypothetical protein